MKDWKSLETGIEIDAGSFGKVSLKKQQVSKREKES